MRGGRTRDVARDGEAGLTLVEVLVVLAIVGVMTGVTMLGGGLLDRGARAEAEAMRLAQRLQLAADTAMATEVPHALVWDAEGYGFVGWDAGAGAWQASADARLGARHALPGALRLDGGAQGGAEAGAPAPIVIAADLAAPPVALRVVGPGTVWRVDFDGFAARAERTP